MYAAKFGLTETVKVLIDQGANINEKTPTNQTALKHAVVNSHPDIIQSLKQAGVKEYMKFHAAPDVAKVSLDRR